MGLRIQNNIAAMNAHRQLTISDTNLGKNLERLSSGFRINRAADDAAGLSISQQFRADIASYKVASRNTSEANSLLQVAEGGLDQIGNMLTRMKELATQAASANAGSNLDKINAEYGKLMSEIDRIANSTEYAGSKLINGTFGVTVSATTLTGANGYSGVSGLKAGEVYTVTTVAGTGATKFDITIANANGDSQMLNEVGTPSAGNTSNLYFSSLGPTLTINQNIAAAMSGTITASGTGNSTFQVGSKSDANNQISFSLDSAQSVDLGKLSGGTALNLNATLLNTAANAQDAMKVIDKAITDLNVTRGAIGANQNRLGYASANLASTIENVQAAESVIRDVDMAAEMTSFTKNQILLQASTAMLAQANSAPQNVLSLFK